MGKKAKFGVNTYVKRDRPRKRPGRHKKILINTKKDRVVVAPTTRS